MAAEVLGWHHAWAGAVWAQGRGGSCPGPRHTHLTPTPRCSSPGLELGPAGKGDSLILYPVLVLGRFLPCKCWAGVWQQLRSHSTS